LCQTSQIFKLQYMQTEYKTLSCIVAVPVHMAYILMQQMHDLYYNFVVHLQSNTDTIKAIFSAVIYVTDYLI